MTYLLPFPTLDLPPDGLLVGKTPKRFDANCIRPKYLADDAEALVYEGLLFLCDVV